MAGLRSHLGPFFLLPILLAWSLPSIAQSNTKRLILKDGSYQVATKWQLTGDRVRFTRIDEAEFHRLAGQRL